MLNWTRNVALKGKHEYATKSIRITRLWYHVVVKKNKYSRIYLYNGDTINEKKLSVLDMNNLLGYYVMTRKPYAKPEKYFKFKY